MCTISMLDRPERGFVVVIRFHGLVSKAKVTVNCRFDDCRTAVLRVCLYTDIKFMHFLSRVV